jgi:hypothetical protein
MTKKKPSLTVVGATPSPGLPPPASLGKFGADLWRSIQSEFAITDSGGIELLYQACVAADRAAELATQIKKDGVTIHTENGAKSHPCISLELRARALVCRTLSRLGVATEPVKPVGRPGHGVGWTGYQR